MRYGRDVQFIDGCLFMSIAFACIAWIALSESVCTVRDLETDTILMALAMAASSAS